MSSIREVAKLANVSVGSVSRYLNGQILKEENMKKIENAIKELDYKENIIAKGLKNNQSFSIGLLMNSISSRFGAEVVSGIEQVMEQNGYSILLSGFNSEYGKIEEKIDYLMKHSVDGLIVFVTGDEWDGLEKLSSLSIPVVAINNPSLDNEFGVVTSDDRKCVRSVMEKIVSMNHKKIGIIGANDSDYVMNEKLSGVKDVEESTEGVSFQYYYGDYSRNSGFLGARELITKGVTALFITNFNMSVGALEYMNQQKISIGEDILFSHYDYSDAIPFQSESRIIIETPTFEMGVESADLLLKKMKKQEFNASVILQNKIFTN